MIYLRDFYFPSMPEQIQVSTGANYQNYSLLQGKTAIPNGTDIKKVKWHIFWKEAAPYSRG